MRHSALNSAGRAAITNAGIQTHVSFEEWLEGRLFAHIPDAIMPATTLWRWGQQQCPKVQHYESLRLYLHDRIPAAFEHNGKTYVKLDQRIINEHGLLVAVRSVKVLPAK